MLDGGCNEIGRIFRKYNVKYGFTVEKKFEGIHYVYGLHLPAQIVVTKELDRKKHRSLRVPSEDALEEDARAFIEYARKLTDQGDLINVDAILHVSVSANYNLYNELKRRYPEMCKAMKTLMKDEMMEAAERRRKERHPWSAVLSFQEAAVDKITE